MRSILPPRRLIVTASLACLLPSSGGAAIVVNEDFSSSGFFTSFIQPSDATNFSYADGESTPDGTLIVSHIHDSERDENDFPLNTEMLDLASLVRITNVSYTPSESGAINTLSVKLDYRTTDPFSEAYFFIQQLSSGVLGGSTAIDKPGDQDGNWKTLEVVGLTDADFLGQGFFSASNPLTFGFGFASAAMVDPSGIDPVIYQIEVDNFQVIVEPVPEPSSALLLFGAGALLLRRKRSVDA